MEGCIGGGDAMSPSSASLQSPPKGGLLRRMIKGSTLLLGGIGLNLASLGWLSPEARAIQGYCRVGGWGGGSQIPRLAV